MVRYLQWSHAHFYIVSMNIKLLITLSTQAFILVGWTFKAVDNFPCSHSFLDSYINLHTTK